jgi:hypothetical protein
MIKLTEIKWYTWLLVIAAVTVFAGFGPLAIASCACLEPHSGDAVLERGYYVWQGARSQCEWSTCQWSHPSTDSGIRFCGVAGSTLYNILYDTNSVYTTNANIGDFYYTTAGSEAVKIPHADILFKSSGDTVCGPSNLQYMCYAGPGSGDYGWRSTGAACGGVSAECAVAGDCLAPSPDWEGKRSCIANRCVYESVPTPKPPTPVIERGALIGLLLVAAITSLFWPRKVI